MAIEKKEFVCIVCPNGCLLEVTKDDDKLIVEGNECKRGIPFAENEMTCPMRSISSTVATSFEDMPLISVRTKDDIPKVDIPKAMQAINKVLVKKRVKIGEVIVPDICGTDIIATMDMTLAVPSKRIQG